MTTERERLERRLARERQARQEAERIGERATRELYAAVRALEAKNLALDEARTALAAELTQLSMPILRTWPGVLTFAIVGGMNEVTVAAFHERVLASTVDERARVVIFDASAWSAPSPDVAEGIARIVDAVRLLGARPLLCGLGAEAAARLVDDGIDLPGVEIYAAQGDAMRSALAHLGFVVERRPRTRP